MIPAPKIIFSDIDGTFLLDDHTVSEKSAEAVRALLASGIPFVLVSARMPEAIYPITQSIGVTIPIISYSGALALTAEGETLEDVRVDAGAAGMVLSAIEDRYPELTVNYYAGRRWYVRDEDDPRVRHEEDITHAKSSPPSASAPRATSRPPTPCSTSSAPRRTSSKSWRPASRKKAASAPCSTTTISRPTTPSHSVTTTTTLRCCASQRRASRCPTPPNPSKKPPPTSQKATPRTASGGG